MTTGNPCFCNDTGAETGAGVSEKFAAPDTSKPQIATAEDPDQSDNDQVYGDDVIQQARHHENKNAGNQRNQRSERQVNVHEAPLSIQSS